MAELGQCEVCGSTRCSAVNTYALIAAKVTAVAVIRCGGTSTVDTSWRCSSSDAGRRSCGPAGWWLGERPRSLIDRRGSRGHARHLVIVWEDTSAPSSDRHPHHRRGQRQGR